MTERRLLAKAAAGFALVWGTAFIVYTGCYGGAATLPLLSLLVLGLLLPLLAWPLIRKISPPEAPRLAGRESAIALLYIALFSAVVLGSGFSWVRDEVGSKPVQEIVLLAAKLLFMVAIPLLLMRTAERRALAARPVRRRPILIATAVLGASAAGISALATSAVPQIEALGLGLAALGLAVAGTAIWVTLGAALTEEILFRAYLQPRLATLMRSEAFAVAAGAIIFALVHVPGLYLRTDQADLMQNGSPSLISCIAYAIAVLAPPGILFGVLWSKTRSLFLVVTIHALIDLPPNIAEFAALIR